MEVPGLDRVLSRGGWPLASAPPVDEADPGRYAALFGRDALITSLQLLPVRPEVARATLLELARLQGRRDDPEIDEEPGKIIHEHWPRPPQRLLELGWSVRDGQIRYYGSADSTSWFLVVLATLADDELTRELEPSWRAAGAWLERALERGGGLVRHGPRERRGGLEQQGWRDTRHPGDPRGHGAGILRPDGSAPKPPLADADSQAVALIALRSLAGLSGERRHLAAAAAMAVRVEEAFGPETMAIEGDGREVPGAGSQLGWLLWSGALSARTQAGLAERLSSPDVLTPWGLRTLSDRHPTFRPDAYHRGSVWAFDSWLGWGGLRATGAEETAERVRAGVLEALERLSLWPELYAVDGDGPRRIAISNRIQAWTVGAAWALENEWEGRITAPHSGVQIRRREGNG